MKKSERKIKRLVAYRLFYPELGLIAWITPQEVRKYLFYKYDLDILFLPQHVN